MYVCYFTFLVIEITILNISALGSGVGILLRSIVADTYKTPEEKKTFFGKCAPVMSIAFLVGSVSSGFLTEVRNGFSLAFFAMAIIMGVAACKFRFQPSKQQQKPQIHFLNCLLLN